MVHRAGGDLVISAADITNADHTRWQRHAVSELAAILNAHARVPVIACTAGPVGGLSGPVSGPALAGVRAAFAAWRDAPRSMTSWRPAAAAGQRSGCVPAPGVAGSASA